MFSDLLRVILPFQLDIYYCLNSFVGSRAKYSIRVEGRSVIVTAASWANPDHVIDLNKDVSELPDLLPLC